MITTVRDVLAAARGLADDLLFPDATRVDGLDVLPVAHLDALAALGLYGVHAPVQAGGLGLDLAATCAVVEELAGGCLTTTFVWLQHRGLVMTLAAEGTPAALRDRWLGPACRGEVRGGIALTGLIPGPPLLRRHVRSEDRAGVPAAGQFGQVEAIAAADVGHDLRAVRRRQAQHATDQVHGRLLVGIDGLPRGQVHVRLVLDFPQERGIRPQLGPVGSRHCGLSATSLRRPRTTRARCLSPPERAPRRPPARRLTGARARTRGTASMPGTPPRPATGSPPARWPARRSA
jgi:hypothetical protein